MPKVDDVRILEINGVPQAVDAMSDTVKKMIAIFNEWSQREADVRNELLLVQAAKQDLSRQISVQIRNEQEAQHKAPSVAPSNSESVPAVTPESTEPSPTVEPAE